jgi:general secretion pathway protein D
MSRPASEDRALWDRQHMEQVNMTHAINATTKRSTGAARIGAAAAITVAMLLGSATSAQTTEPADPPAPAVAPAVAESVPTEVPAPPTTAPVLTPPTTNGSATRPSNGSGGIKRENGLLSLNFQDASIDVVLDELSAAAGFIVVKEVRPEGRVSLVSRQPVKPEEAVELLNTVLRNGGYVAIQQERVLKIVSASVAKRLNIPVRTGNDPTRIARSDELITQVIPLRFSDATQLKNDLQPLINPDADFASNASSNALVITDTSANIRRVVEIVAALDTSMANSVDVRVFQLKYASSTTAAQLINSVFGTLQVGAPGGGGGQGGNQGNNQGPPRSREEAFQRFAQMQQQGGRGGNNQQQQRIVNAAADERTNSVVVSGPSETLEAVAQVVKELDANPAAEETVFVYRLRNSQAVNIEGVLNSLFNGTAVTRTGSQTNTLQNARQGANNTQRSTRSTGGTSGTGRTIGGAGNTGRTLGGNTGGFGGQAQGGFVFGGGQGRVSQNARATGSALAGQVSIIADTDTNSLLVRTSPGNYDRVRAVLEELDKPVAQVLIKVLIAEVTHENARDLGVEFSILNLRASGNGQTGGTSFNIPTVGASATGLVVQLIEENVSATIRALETEGKLDVLSRPYILASDNQLASITVGQEVPFITNSRITDTGQTINTIEYGDVGILLDVVPHINPDGLVILDVAPEISTLTGTTVPISELVSAPVIAKRSAQSRVAVQNGQTIVIGGLMEDRVVSTLDKVPLLGDIPGLGELFRRTRTNKSKTELLIFLTPHVAADPRRLQQMGQEELEGTRLIPNAVAPGVFDQHMEGMQRQNLNAPPGFNEPLPETPESGMRVPGRGGRGPRGGTGPGTAPGGEPTPADPGAFDPAGGEPAGGEPAGGEPSGGERSGGGEPGPVGPPPGDPGGFGPGPVGPMGESSPATQP